MIVPHRPASRAIDIADAAIRHMHVDRLLERGLAAADLATIPPSSRVFVVAIGKVAPAMARKLAAVFGSRLTGGVVVSAVPVPSPERAPRLQYVVGDHPVPGVGSASAGRALLAWAAQLDAGPDDVVLLAVSGGGSALVVAPRPPARRADLTLLYAALVKSGLDVTTMNHARAAVSRVHGGNLLHLLQPARVVSFVLSDNVQVGASAVASGIAAPEFLQVDRGREVIRGLGLEAEVQARLMAAASELSTTFSGRLDSLVIGTPDDLLGAARQEATRMGYEIDDLGSLVQGEARDFAQALGRRLVAADSATTRGPLCIVGTGEVVVKVAGRGAGGRCQELAYAMSEPLRKIASGGFAAVASDGRDFIPGVMGAWANEESFSQLATDAQQWRAQLERNDTHPPLQRAGLCLTGRDTATNLCDVYVACLPARPAR